MGFDACHALSRMARSGAFLGMGVGDAKNGLCHAQKVAHYP